MSGSAGRPPWPVALVAVLVGIVAATSGAGAPSAAAADAEGDAQRVLVLSLPAVSWRDLDLDELPNLRALLDESAIGNLSTRGVRRRPTLGDGYVTVNAGTRAVGRPDDGQCLDAGEPFEESVARDAMARRAGIPPDAIPDGAVVCLAQPAIADHNDDLLYDAEVGALGDALAAAGVHRAVIGNADHGEPTGTVAYGRRAGLALADRHGVVPGGVVGSGLMMLDAAAPYGVRADPAAYLAAFEAAWGERERAVVLVEASDLVRFDEYRRTVAVESRSGMQRSLLRAFDELVGELVGRVDPARDAVLVVGPASADGTARLTVAAQRAPGTPAGLVRSSYTRRAGVVSIVDVGPTILSLLGVERPESMEGRPFEAVTRGSELAARVDRLADVDEAAQFRDRMIVAVTTWFVVFQVLLILLAVYAFTRRRGLLPAVEVGALALLGFLPATYLAGLLPFHEWGAAAYWCFVAGICIAVAAIVHGVTSRHGVDTLLASLGVLVGVLVVDLVTGAHLQFNTALGYSPTIAGRFAGIGNLAYSQLAAGSVLLAGLLAHRIGGRRGAWAGVALLGAAVVVDGAPFWGADVGGVLSMVPAYGITAALLLGWRVRLRTLALFGAATVGVLALFAAFDAGRSEDDQTHLGRLVHRTSDEGWDAFVTVVERKWDANLDVLFSSVWTIMLPLVLAGIAYLVYRAPGRLRGIYEQVPPLRASIAGLGALALLGFLLNDSGIAIPGVMLGVVTPVLLVLLVRAERGTLAADALAAPLDLDRTDVYA